MDASSLATQAADIAKDAMPTIEATGKALVSWLQSGADLAKEQTPLIVHEALVWGIFQSAFYLLMGLLFFMLPGAFFARHLRRNWDSPAFRDKDKDMTGLGACYLVGALGGIGAGSVIFLVNTFNLGFVIFAPRLYLIQYLAALVHGK